MNLSKFCSSISGNSKHLEKFKELKTKEDRINFTYDLCREYLGDEKLQRLPKANYPYVSTMSLKRFLDSDQKWKQIELANESVACATAGADLTNALERRAKCLESLKLSDHELINGDTPLETKIKNPKSEKRDLYIGNGSKVPLSNGESSFFDSASKSVRLSYTEHWERHLVALDDIKTGEVLIVEKPYASVLFSTHVYTHCSYCYKRSFTLKPCGDCCFAMFCDTICFNKSLEHFHKTECKISDLLFATKVGNMELLSLRILIFASKQGKELKELSQAVHEWEESKKNSKEDNVGPYRSSDFWNIYNLVTNSDKRPPSDLLYRYVASAFLVHLLSRYTEFFSFVPQTERQHYEMFCVGLISHFMQSLPCNAHEVSEFNHNGLDEIGAGIYATLSLANHSCDPNVVRYCCGDSIVLRAIKPIKKNQQIFDNYGYHYATHSLSERQKALMQQYYFKCECEACTNKWPMYQELIKKDVKFRKSVEMKEYNSLTEKFEGNLKTTLTGNFDEETLQELTSYLDYLHEIVQLPWRDINNCQEAIKHCWWFYGNHFRQSKAAV